MGPPCSHHSDKAVMESFLNLAAAMACESGIALQEAQDCFREAMVRTALVKAGRKPGKAAAMLGIHRNTFHQIAPEATMVQPRKKPA